MLSEHLLRRIGKRRSNTHPAQILSHRFTHHAGDRPIGVRRITPKLAKRVHIHFRAEFNLVRHGIYQCTCYVMTCQDREGLLLLPKALQ